MNNYKMCCLLSISLYLSFLIYIANYVNSWCHFMFMPFLYSVFGGVVNIAVG